MPQAVLQPTTPTGVRTVTRGANPFAPIVIQQNQNLVSVASNVYEALDVRGNRVFNHPSVQQAIRDLRKRLGGHTYNQLHFGQLLLVRAGLIDINVDIQRDEDPVHIAEDIIARFDPRICMPVMCTKLANGRYSAWEGQQTSLTIYVLLKAGIINEDTLIQVKAVDEDLEVPGTTLKGEAVGNMGFRIINGGGRKPIDAFHLHRSRVTGVRIYGSQFEEDLQSEEIQQILEKNTMFPAKASDASGQKAMPGMVTYIHGLNLLAAHGSDQKVFNLAKTDLDWALKWHNTYYPSEKGVDGGFMLAFGRLHHAARTQNPAVTLDATVEADLFRLFQSKYGSPKGFHNDCKNRLRDWQELNRIRPSWSDSCLTPMLVMDYLKSGGTCILPQVSGMVTYAGI